MNSSSILYDSILSTPIDHTPPLLREKAVALKLLFHYPPRWFDWIRLTPLIICQSCDRKLTKSKPNCLLFSRRERYATTFLPFYAKYHRFPLKVHPSALRANLGLNRQSYTIWQAHVRLECKLKSFGPWWVNGTPHDSFKVFYSDRFHWITAAPHHTPPPPPLPQLFCNKRSVSSWHAAA